MNYKDYTEYLEEYQLIFLEEFKTDDIRFVRTTEDFYIYKNNRGEYLKASIDTTEFYIFNDEEDLQNNNPNYSLD